MTTETFLGAIGVTVAILTLGVVVLSGYLAYLAQNLAPRLEKKVKEQVAEAAEAQDKKVDSQLVLIEMALEIVARDVEGEEARLREEAYALRQLARLSSGRKGEIEKGLGALEALGSEAFHLLPYVERLRNVGGWPPELEERFDERLRDLRREVRRERRENVGLE